jgi:hypothetical protein
MSFARARLFDHSQLARRKLHALGNDPGWSACVAGTEDTILAKLEWFLMVGGASDRPWRDVLGILKVRTNRLHSNYLNHMAAELGVTDLPGKALDEAGCL